MQKTIRGQELSEDVFILGHDSKEWGNSYVHWSDHLLVVDSKPAEGKDICARFNCR